MFSKVKSTFNNLKRGNFAQISGDIKKSFVDLDGTVTRSDFYFTNTETNEELNLFITPEKVSVKTGASFRNFSIVNIGEVKIPKGEQLTGISWRGIIAGADKLLYPFGNKKNYEQPIEITKVFKRWRETGAKIKLLVTQTPINLEVYLKDFDYTLAGGMGAIEYSIDLIAAKELKYMTVAEADAAREQKAQQQDNALQERMTKKKKSQQIVKSLEMVDKIFAVAKILTGKGGLHEVEQLTGSDLSFLA